MRKDKDMPGYKPTHVMTRIMNKVTITDSNCWEYSGTIAHGYGKIGIGYRKDRSTRTVPVHRVTYKYLMGEIPDGLDIDHLCRNRACCNPLHLEPVTRSVNILRGLIPIIGGKHNKEKIVCSNGHPFDSKNTYIHPVNGRRHCRICRNGRQKERRRENA